MPRAKDSGDPEPTSHNGCPDAALRQANGVGIATKKRFRSWILTACFLAVYASHPPVARRMATRATGLPATALTGLDLHQLDFNEEFLW